MYYVYGHRQDNRYQQDPALFDFLCETATRNMLRAIDPYVSAEGSVRFCREIFAGKWYDNERIDDFFHDISRYVDPSAVRPKIREAAGSILKETEMPLTADILIGMELVHRELTRIKKLLAAPEPEWFDRFGNYLFYLLSLRIEDRIPLLKAFGDECFKAFREIETIHGYDEDNMVLAQRVTIPSEMQFLDSWYNTLNNNGEEFFGVSFADGMKKLRKEKFSDDNEDVFISLGLEKDIFDK